MLTIDEKEARSNPIAKRSLFAILKEDVEVDGLLSADYASLDTPLTLGIEYKAFANLVGDLSNNHLDKQLAKLVESYDVPVLLIGEMPAPTGNGKLQVFGAKRSVNFNWVMGAVFGWALRGVVPLFARTPATVGPMIASCYRTVAKEEHREAYEPLKILHNLRPMSLVERILIQLPGVGPERAAKMKEYTIEGLNDLDEDTWKQALGPLTGRRAYSAWHGETDV